MNQTLRHYAEALSPSRHASPTSTRSRHRQRLTQSSPDCAAPLERVESRGDRRAGGCTGSPEGKDATRRRWVNRYESDQRWRRFAAQPRDHGDAQAGRNQRQLGRVLRRGVHHAWLDSIRAQRTDEPVVADLAGAPADPVVASEFLDSNAVPVGERVIDGQRHVERVVQQVPPRQALGHGQHTRRPSPGRRRHRGGRDAGPGSPRAAPAPTATPPLTRRRVLRAR